VLPLFFAGCSDENEFGGSSGPGIPAAAFVRIEPVTNDATTTTLLLVFDRDIPGLKEEHITISSAPPESSEIPVSPEISENSVNPEGSENPEGPVPPESPAPDVLKDVAIAGFGKTDGRPGVYTLALAGIDELEESLWPIDKFSGKLNVTVEANDIPGYSVAASSHQTDIYVVPPRRDVTFSGAIAASNEILTKTTAGLVLQISEVDGGTGSPLGSLMRDDVVLSASGEGNSGIGIGTGDPVEVDGGWYIPVTGIDTEGTVTVTLTRNGYRFVPSLSKEVPVHYAKPAAIVTAKADGHEVLAVRSSKLTLTFDEPIGDLSLNNITITANGTGAAKGTAQPVQDGNSYTLNLAQNSVTTSGEIGVTVTKDGYDIPIVPVQVAVYDDKYSYLAEGGTVISIITVDNVPYEMHKFTTVGAGTLAFKSTPNLTAQVLVVAGGGGGGKSAGANWRAGGGGGVSTDSKVPTPTGGKIHGSSGAGGAGQMFSGGGGGGAGGAGVAPTAAYAGAKGGEGISSSITGTAVYYGGGGTSGSNVTQDDTRGAYNGNAGAANTGDGGCGGGGSSSVSGTAGGSGIVVVRFPVPAQQ
jgi:hypothetical protein